MTHSTIRTVAPNETLPSPAPPSEFGRSWIGTKRRKSNGAYYTPDQAVAIRRVIERVIVEKGEPIPVIPKGIESENEDHDAVFGQPERGRFFLSEIKSGTEKMINIDADILIDSLHECMCEARKLPPKEKIVQLFFFKIGDKCRVRGKNLPRKEVVYMGGPK